MGVGGAREGGVREGRFGMGVGGGRGEECQVGGVRDWRGVKGWGRRGQ